MQQRHNDPLKYFDETVVSARRYYIPYLEQHGVVITPGMRVLDVGCGLGGVLAAFARLGCDVTGVDIHAPSIRRATEIYASRSLSGHFECADILQYGGGGNFDLIILHDTFEHLHNKAAMLRRLGELTSASGVLYIGFPAWMMPFGGHQQMAKNKFLSHFAWSHLLPRGVFRAIYTAGGCGDAVADFFDIRDTKVTVEGFERLLRKEHFEVVDRTLWLINPNYETKFGMRPRKLSRIASAIPLLRDFMATTCYYIIKPLR